jgi:hypothetical protein
MAVSPPLSQTPDLASLSPRELVALRFRSIANWEFETAAAVDDHLAQSRCDAESTAFSSALTDLTSEIDSAVSLFASDSETIAYAFQRRALDARLAIDDLFEQCKQRQVEELNSIEKEYAISVLRAERRPVRDEIDLREHSRRLALAGEYKASVKAREQAKVAGVPEIARRRAEIDARFEKLRAVKFERHFADLCKLNERLKSDLERIETEREETVAQQQRRFVVAARVARRKAIARATAPLVDPDRKVEAADAVAAEAERLVRAATGIELEVSDNPRHDGSRASLFRRGNSPRSESGRSRPQVSEGSVSIPSLADLEIEDENVPRDQ